MLRDIISDNFINNEFIEVRNDRNGRRSEK